MAHPQATPSPCRAAARGRQTVSLGPCCRGDALHWAQRRFGASPAGSRLIAASKRIGSLLQERSGRRGGLQRLLRQSADQAIWTAELRAILPKNLRTACQVMDVRGTALIVVCMNSAVATRLRLLSPELAQKLRDLPHFSHIEQIHAKVSPD